MEKTKVIVDTCFLQKISSEGKKTGNIQAVLDELGWKPVVHPYVAEYELSLHAYTKKMIESGYIQKIEYKDFLQDEYAMMQYEGYFIRLHEK